jgi:hypothetical protein
VQRELQAVSDTAPEGALCWARQASDALGRVRVMVGEAIAANAERLDETAFAEQVSALRSTALLGLKETSARTGKLMKKHNALAKRLIERHNDYLRFAVDWRIPADSNGSEGDIRMITLRQKVSGCQRTLLL